MAGHSKRHNIKHKKAKEDAKKSKIYAKIAKLISVAARKGTDPDMNPSLAQALQKAKYNSLPKDVITKALQKGSGTDVNHQDFQEIIYEGYGYEGVGFLIKTLTDNPNRTHGNIKLIFQKNGGDLAKPGAVARGFEEKGTITIQGKKTQQQEKGNIVDHYTTFVSEELELLLMELDVLSYTFPENQVCEIYTSKEAFLQTCDMLSTHEYHITEADLAFVPTNPLEVSEDIKNKNLHLQDIIEEDDDVDTVWHSMA